MLFCASRWAGTATTNAAARMARSFFISFGLGDFVFYDFEAVPQRRHSFLQKRILRVSSGAKEGQPDVAEGFLSLLHNAGLGLGGGKLVGAELELCFAAGLPLP